MPALLRIRLTCAWFQETPVLVTLPFAFSNPAIARKLNPDALQARKSDMMLA